MINYIKNAKQCFTDKNIQITKVCLLDGKTVSITAKTFHYMPDIKNSNIFHISLNYFEKLKKEFNLYFGMPKAKKYN
jgi:hypothetical protein